MKKILLFSFAFMLTMVAAVAQKTVPYSSSIGSSSVLDADWTVINANGDVKTWTNQSAQGAAYYSYNASMAADDWLVSPAIALEAGNAYRFSWVARTGSPSFKESLEVVIATSSELAALQAGTMLYSNYSFGDSSYKTYNASFTPDTSESYYVAFHVCSAKDLYGLYIKDFSAKLDVYTPAPVTDLTATADPEKTVKVTLNWTLPTTDQDGADLTKALTAIRITRDGTALPDIEGTATSFIDTEANGLTAGFHDYTVTAVIDNGVSPAVAVRTKYVGPVTPSTVPYTADMSTNDAVEAVMNIIDANEDGKTWSWYNYYKCMSFSTSGATVEDDYVVSAPLALTAGGYKLTYKANGSNGRLTARLGTNNTKEALTTVLGVDDMIGYGDADYSHVFEVPADGTYYIAIHADNNPHISSNYSYYLKSIEVVESPIAPGVATELSAVPAADESLSATVSWVNPTVKNSGAELTAIQKVELYRGETLIYTNDATTPGASLQYVDNEIPAAGFYTYNVYVYDANGNKSEVASVDCNWVGDPVQVLPYSNDFSNAQKNLLWTIKDVNNDGVTYKIVVSTSSYTLSSAQIGAYSTTTECNDYLIAPPFEATEGSFYKVTFSPAGYSQSIEYGYLTDINDLSTFVSLGTKENMTSSSVTSSNITEVSFQAPSTGRIYMAWRNVGTISSIVQVGLVTISETFVLPNVATELAVAAVEGDPKAASISWKNPAEGNVAGVSYGDLVKAEVYVDGTLFTTFTEGLGAAGEVVTKNLNNVPAGVHTYGVKVYNANGASEAAMPTVKSPWLGSGLDIPYTFNFGTNTFSAENGWTKVNLRDGKETWYLGSNTMGSNYSNQLNNGWAISPRLNFTSRGTASKYLAEFQTTVSLYDSNTELPLSYDVYYSAKAGAEVATDADAVKIGEITATIKGSTQTSSFEFSLPEAATNEGSIGIYVNFVGCVDIYNISISDLTPVTGINGIENVSESSNVTYNLAGQRVNNSAKGIVISNGNKVVRK